MKNVMKKVFSLFLVGVVAVSMFGFITPNRVDAAETNAIERICIQNRGSKALKYLIYFYLEGDPELTKPLNSKRVITVSSGKSLDVNIDPRAKFVCIKTELVDKCISCKEVYEEFVCASSLRAVQ